MRFSERGRAHVIVLRQYKNKDKTKQIEIILALQALIKTIQLKAEL